MFENGNTPGAGQGQGQGQDLAGGNQAAGQWAGTGAAGNGNAPPGALGYGPNPGLGYAASNPWGQGLPPAQGQVPPGVPTGGPGSQAGPQPQYPGAPYPAPGGQAGGGQAPWAPYAYPPPYPHPPLYQHQAQQGYGPAPQGPGYAAYPGPGPGQGAGAGAGPGGVSRFIEELAGGGNGLSSLTQMLSLDDKEMWKGALIGAAVVLLFTNESVQNTLFKTGVRARDAVKSGVGKVRSRVQETGRDATGGGVNDHE